MREHLQAVKRVPLNVNLSFAKEYFMDELQVLNEKVKLVKECNLKLSEEAIDLQDYLNAKFGRLLRYLGAQTEKTCELGWSATEVKAKISPCLRIKHTFFDDLLSSKGNVRVVCYASPLFAEEDCSVIDFPDEITLRIKAGDNASSSSKKDFEFDRVYGPHDGQAELFCDVQPFLQLALEGHNASVLAFGHSYYGKKHTMEGSGLERGLHVRCYEELFYLAKSASTFPYEFKFSVSAIELHNEQIRDLLLESDKRWMKFSRLFLDENITHKRVDSPIDFSKVLNAALQNRNDDIPVLRTSHLIFTIHIHHSDLITGLGTRSKLFLVDTAGWDDSFSLDHNGDVHITQSLSMLRAGLLSRASNVDFVPEKSVLTEVISESLGADVNKRALMILCISPCCGNLLRILSFLNPSASLGSASRSHTNLGIDKKAKYAENVSSDAQCKMEMDHYSHLTSQIYDLSQNDKEQRILLLRQDFAIRSLHAKVRTMELRLNDFIHSIDLFPSTGFDPRLSVTSPIFTNSLNVDSSSLKTLEEELAKRESLVQKLHEENEKLFTKLTGGGHAEGCRKVITPLEEMENIAHNSERSNSTNTGICLDVVPSSLFKNGLCTSIESISDKVQSTLAGEYLTSTLNGFDSKLYDSPAATSDGANKILMLILAAVVKAGPYREHEMLAEIKEPVFSFIHKIEPAVVMDTMLVSRVRILYCRSLVATSSELKHIKVSPVECFLEKSTGEQSRSTVRGQSPGRSALPISDGHFKKFKLNLKPEKKSRLASVVLKMRGIDDEAWQMHVIGEKLKVIQEEARTYALGNMALASLFVHTPANELQCQIKCWIMENFGFLSAEENALDGATCHSDLISAAIVDGWMSGLGTALPPSTDALGRLYSKYTKLVYSSKLQHLKGLSSRLANEVTEDMSQVIKLRLALESVSHKRSEILQQMRSDTTLAATDDSDSPIQYPSTAPEDARLASLVSLESLLKQVKDLVNQATENILTTESKNMLLASLNKLREQMSSLLDIDHPCLLRQIKEAYLLVESIAEEDEAPQQMFSYCSKSPQSSGSNNSDISQWNVLQFNTGSSTSFIIKCGSNSKSELVIKADVHVQDPKSGELMRVLPKPNVLENMSLDEIKELFSDLPEAISLLSLARTADGTRARFSRLYRTLAMKVPSLKNVVDALEREGLFKDIRS